MVVVKTRKENSRFKGITTAVNFDNYVKQLKYYFAT